MKVTLIAVVLLFSVVTYGQSVVVMKNGKVITFDDQGMAYDSANFILPYKIKQMGGRYFISDDRKIYTVDKKGFLYSKEKENKVPSSIEHFGDNYFVSRKGRIFTIDEQGFFYRGEKEREFRNVIHAGGNFLIVEKKEDGEKKKAIFVVNNLGNILEVTVPELNLDEVAHASGRYFITERGELFTVSDDGFVYSKKEMGIFKRWELKKGNNYFFDHNSLYSVSDEGILSIVGKSSDFGTIKHLGTNFFINTAGKVFSISSAGEVRNIPFQESLMNISYFSHL